MTKLIIGALFMSGFLMAAAEPPQLQPMRNGHVSYFQRRALRTQSPAVRFTKHNKAKANYLVSENKTTIVAVVPYHK